MAGNKTDMDRIGIFKEMEYISIGDKYVGGNTLAFNAAAGKGKQLLAGGLKTKSAKMDGYFSKEFSKLFDGEAYSDPIKIRRKFRMEEAKKNVGKPFLPSNGEKKPSGLGNHYGTLGGPVEHFKGAAKSENKVKGGEKKNILTNPGKRGGFGYIGVTLNKYPENKADGYDRPLELYRKEVQEHKKAVKGGAFKLNMHPKSIFDENIYKGDKPMAKKEANAVKKDIKPFKPSSPPKKPGNMHAGTFESYPSHSNDKYTVVRFGRTTGTSKSGKNFIPNQGIKSTPVVSVVNHNVIKSINAQNYKTLTAVMSY